MKVLFHAEQLNYRGTTNSVVDYARYNQEILGNESAIIYDIDSSGIAGFEIGSNPKVIEYIKTLELERQQALGALLMMRDRYSDDNCPACDHADAAIKMMRSKK